ncbi:MAG: two-component regulator propeller domain-containing protein, partial [Bacteroidota bacterium]
MQRLKNIFFSLALIFFLGCLPEVDTIDPASIVEWENYTISDGLAGNQVNAITEDYLGNLWIATDNGVSKFDGTNFTNYTTSDGLAGDSVTSIIEYEPDLMVCGTNGGLSVMENGSWNYVDLGVFYKVISLGVDSDGYGWIGTDNYGLLLTDGVDFYQVWDDECLYCNMVNTMYLDSQGTMWFGTYDGLKSL